MRSPPYKFIWHFGFFIFLLHFSVSALAAPSSTRIKVNPSNSAPVANSQNVTVNEDEALAITVTASDANNNLLTYSLRSSPVHGSKTRLAVLLERCLRMVVKLG